MKSRRSRGTGEEKRSGGSLAASTIARAFSRNSSSLVQIGELAHRLKSMRPKGSKILRHQPCTIGFVKIFGSKVQDFFQTFPKQ